MCLLEAKGLHLIEETSNGNRPKAAETVFQSLATVYDAQVMTAAHSPVLLSLVKPKDAGKVLCLAKVEDGSADIVSGHRHRNRSRVAASLAGKIFVAYAAPGSKTEAFCRELAGTGKPCLTFDDPKTDNLKRTGFVPLITV